MSELCSGSVRCNIDDLQEALSIHTRKITDSCRDKDCIEDLRVFLTRTSQNALDSCGGAKVRCAELLYTYIDVEPVAFDDHHYCVETTFYYRILADAVVGAGRPVTLCGVAVFSKRAVLCGENTHAHIYTSNTRLNAPDGLSVVSANRPTAVVEVLDPMVLCSRVVDVCHCPRESAVQQIPHGICECFDEELVLCGEQRQLLVTLGQFSIIRLERDAQLVVPVLDYSIPTKECSDSASCAEDPCEMFSKIPFPTRQFAPNGCDRDCDCDHCGYTTT